MNKLLLFFIISFILFSCSGEKKSALLDEVITKNNLISIYERLKSDKDISIEELEMFSNGLSSYNFSIDSVLGKKVWDIIEKQRANKRDYILKILNTQSANFQIHMNLGFKYLGVQKADSDNVQTNILHYELSNKSDKPIKKIEGDLEFYDLNNQIVKRFPVVVTYNLDKDKTARFTEAYKHEQGNPRDTIIRSKYVRLQALWKPTLLEFADGKKLTVKYE